MKLSAIVLTKNEENNIERCIQSLDFCDEIIVIDDESTDKTQILAKTKGAKVYHRRLEADFASQRNYGAKKANGEWLLYVDADEVVSEGLMKEIMVEVMRQQTKYYAYYVRRREHFFDKELRYGEVATARVRGFIRLVRKVAGHWEGDVHEVFVTHKSIGQLTQFLDHYSHSTIISFLKDINYYSSIRASQLYKKRDHTSVFEVIVYPFSKFFYTYFIKLGFLDGPEGFIYSFLLAFHSFLVRAKLHLLWFNSEAKS